MKKLFEFVKSKRIEIPVIPSLVFLFIFCLIVSAFSMVSAPGAFSRIKTLGFFNPELIILNTLPIIISALIIFMVFNNAVFAAAVTGSVFVIASIANREKIILRQDPFIPSDISLFNEAMGIVKNFPPKQLALYIFITVFFLLAVITALVFFKTKKIHLSIRICSVVLSLITVFAANTFLYSKDSLYNKFAVNGNIYFDVNQYASKGFVYSFIYKFNTMQIEKPEGYNQNEIVQLENDFQPSEYNTKKLPHIIMIMGEAFSDLSENDHFDFSSYSDPMENIKRLANDKNSLYGHITVPNYGGGTSNTEFDVLTGYSTRYLVKDGISYSYIRSALDSIPKRLKNIGYSTLAIHPGFSWFYNRSNVYPCMGFDNFIHLSSFQGEEKYKGGYIADKYLSDSIIENFEKHVSETDNPLFNFCVTIENHGPYDEKYNAVEKMFDCDVPLTDSQENLLNSYFMGIKDNDIEIGRLADYFSQSDEPVILVFFGDHLPGFSNGMEFFDLLDYNISPDGSLEQQLNVYSTPFLIWENDAAAKLTDFNKKSKDILPENNRISAFYLGTTALQLAGIDNISPYLNFNESLKKILPVMRDDIYMTNNCEFKAELTDEENKNANLLKKWSYYKMFEEKTE